ncbi:MAG: sensor histidine kinase [Hydrogenophaga sp.]|jgi:signal transduction histidine kinase|uniref:sensor histidine kinase n=1 Tax=Hydrogenophaga sp. TaxID=1904254 RepID=UPI004035DBC1
MYQFLENNREELTARCKHKVAQRPQRAATDQQLSHGIPMFLDQLIRTLKAEDEDKQELSTRISGPSGGGALRLSEIGMSATRHGKELLDLGYTVDQVVHDYGDLCQAITDLAFERDAPFAVTEFRTLNRCLDNAIAGAVSEFSARRDAQIAGLHVAEEKQRLGFLVHELRNSLGTATLAVRALELGNMPISGATGAILKRSLAALALQIGRTISEVSASKPQERQLFSLATFISDVDLWARLDVNLVRCRFEVQAVDPTLALSGNKELLHAALANVIQNAFKFTQSDTVVRLSARAAGNRILISVADHCGGLTLGEEKKMFIPFAHNTGRMAGMGLGLSIARQSVEADMGTLTVKDVPGIGCIFTLDLPGHLLH